MPHKYTNTSTVSIYCFQRFLTVFDAPPKIPALAITSFPRDTFGGCSWNEHI